MKHTATFIAGLILLFISCQKGDVMTPPRPQDSDANSPTTFDLPPEEPGGQGSWDWSDVTVTYNPPTSPTTNTAEPFIKSGKASGSFTSNGQLDKFTTDVVVFKTEPSAPNFSFVPPTGAIKVWMGFILRTYGGNYYMIKAYPVAISNGNAYYTSAPVNTPIAAGNIYRSTAGGPIGIPENFSWTPAQYGPDGIVTTPGYWTCSKCEIQSITGDVTVSLLKMNADGTLTLKATVKIGGTTYTIDRVGFKRLV